MSKSIRFLYGFYTVSIRFLCVSMPCSRYFVVAILSSLFSCRFIDVFLCPYYRAIVSFLCFPLLLMHHRRHQEYRNYQRKNRPSPSSPSSLTSISLLSLLSHIHLSPLLHPSPSSPSSLTGSLASEITVAIASDLALNLIGEKCSIVRFDSVYAATIKQ